MSIVPYIAHMESDFNGESDSSGGEGALIAGGGSILGLGTDIGGSIRQPSGWSGVIGFKPTARRISNNGVANIPGPVGSE